MKNKEDTNEQIGFISPEAKADHYLKHFGEDGALEMAELMIKDGHYYKRPEIKNFFKIVKATIQTKINERKLYNYLFKDKNMEIIMTVPYCNKCNPVQMGMVKAWHEPAGKYKCNCGNEWEVFPEQIMPQVERETGWHRKGWSVVLNVTPDAPEELVQALCKMVNLAISMVENEKAAKSKTVK